MKKMAMRFHLLTFLLLLCTSARAELQPDWKAGANLQVPTADNVACMHNALVIYRLYYRNFQIPQDGCYLRAPDFASFVSYYCKFDLSQIYVWAKQGTSLCPVAGDYPQISWSYHTSACFKWTDGSTYVIDSIWGLLSATDFQKMCTANGGDVGACGVYKCQQPTSFTADENSELRCRFDCFGRMKDDVLACAPGNPLCLASVKIRCESCDRGCINPANGSASFVTYRSKMSCATIPMPAPKPISPLQPLTCPIGAFFSYMSCLSAASGLVSDKTSPEYHQMVARCGVAYESSLKNCDPNSYLERPLIEGGTCCCNEKNDFSGRWWISTESRCREYPGYIRPGTCGSGLPTINAGPSATYADRVHAACKSAHEALPGSN